MKLPQWLTSTMWALVLGAALLALGISVGAGWLAWSYRGKIYPGVSVDGVNLGGLTPNEATALLDKTLTFPITGKITLEYEGNTWQAHPIELGFVLDNRAAAQAAYAVGRQGSPWRRLADRWAAWYYGVNLPPVAVFSEPIALKYLDALARQIDRPKKEAVLAIKGTEVIAKPGQVGKRLNRRATAAALAALLPRLRDIRLPLQVEKMPPQIADPSAEAQRLRAILAAPLKVVLPAAAKDDPGPWTFAPKTFAPWLEIKRPPHASHFVIDLNTSPLQGFLERIAPQVERKPANARFHFNEKTHKLVLIQHAVIGRHLKIKESLAAVKKNLLAGRHKVVLAADLIQPRVGDNATAKELGITELVAKYTSYFYGSSEARIHNIVVAAKRFDGYLVAPGEVFSMAKVLGDVSLDTGYAEALIIYGNRTIKGVGGGVCQVSTTLFRTVFFAGYPIIERHPHAYRVLYYEQTPSGGNDPKLAGLDATVYAPVVDFKFKNDTPYWILMETKVSVPYRYLTWKLYSTSDGREVEWHTTGLQNVVDPPPPKYIENPKLKKGEIKQVDWAAKGADVTVTRIVRKNGKILFKDTFYTHYEPWQAVCEYGPGTPGMPPKHPDPKHPCRPDKPDEEDKGD